MVFSDLNYTLLKHFILIYQAGNITRAAHAFGVSAPAFNESLHKLEKQLGVKLFITNVGRGGITPTAEAHTLYKHLLPAFAILEQAKQQITTFDENTEGTIRLRCPAQCYNKVLKAIKKFQSKFPKVEFEVTTNKTLESAELLKNHKLDLIISFEPMKDRFESRVIGEYTDTFFTSRRFLEVHNLGDRITIEQLKRMPIVAAKRVLEKEKFRSILGEIKTIVDLPTFDMIYNAVLDGMGIGFITHEYLDSINNPDIVKLDVVNLNLPPAFLYCSYNAELGRLAQIFLDILLDCRIGIN